MMFSRIYDRMANLGEWLLERYGKLVVRAPAAWVFFALVVFLMTFPLILIRGYHFDEGLAVLFARDLMDGGNPWYEPHLLGVRFIERPQLLGWVLGIVSWPLGDVYQVVARIPTILALYGGALLIYVLMKDYVSRASAIFASLCFLFAPAVLVKVVTAESDLPLTVTSFAAFYLWWRGYRVGKNELWRWMIIGLLLGVTGLFKGPQPAAFFACGIGAFLLWRREWAAVPGYILAGVISLTMVGSWYLVVYEGGDTSVWARFMRLDQNPSLSEYFTEKLEYFVEANASLFPGLIAAIAGIFGFRTLMPEKAERDSVRELWVALLFFVALGYIAVLIWPGGKPRYIFAALPAVAAMAGIVFDRAVVEWQRALIRTAFGFLLVLGVYQGAYNLIFSSVLYSNYADSRIAAKKLQCIIATKEAPLNASYRSADPVLSYLNFPVRYLPRSNDVGPQTPSWLLAREHELEQMQRSDPGLTISFNLDFEYRNRDLVLYYVEAQPSEPDGSFLAAAAC